jgi:CRP/FNR family cyclic AMP-dependent transcriptional regulator
MGDPSFNLKAFLAQTAVGKTNAKYRKKQIVFRQGDPADAVFYIQEGKVKLAVTSRQGKEAILGLLVPGDFFGTGCLVGQRVCMATATATCQCSLLRLEKACATQLLRDEPAFAAQVLTHVLTRNIKIEEDLVDQLFNSSEKRLARVLLLLANFGQDGETEPVVAKISQETLAEMIGTTRPRVSFFMNKFRKLGFIHYNGGLHIHSSLMSIVLRD